MKKFINPDAQEWAGILARPVMDATNLQEICREVFTSVTMEGDLAVNRYAEKFDGFPLRVVNLDDSLIQSVENEIGEILSKSIRQAAYNIEQFHRSQAGQPEKIVTTQGVTCWREDRPIEKVGLYIPGGTAPCSLPYLCWVFRLKLQVAGRLYFVHHPIRKVTYLLLSYLLPILPE